MTLARIGRGLIRRPIRTAVVATLLGALVLLWSDPQSLTAVASTLTGFLGRLSDPRTSTDLAAFLSRPETTTAIVVASAVFVVVVTVWSRLRWRIRRRY